jgi:hypothetical protein
MTRDDIIRMAREAWGEHHEIFWFNDDGIERFAALVAAAEREACAKVCEQMPELEHGWRVNLPNDCAAAIRARSNT